MNKIYNNVVEALADDDETMQSPCKHGNIVINHACYCHNESPDAPRKCHVWRNVLDWNKSNCELFENADSPAE